MYTHLSTPLFKRKNQPVNEDSNRKNDNWYHDDVIEDLNQSEENVQEGDCATDDVCVIQFNAFVGVTSVLNTGSEVFQPIGCIRCGTCW